MDKTIIIGADRLAVPLKDALKHRLEEVHGYQVTDGGMQEGGAFISYIDTACKAAREIQQGHFNRGILLCGTGAGMSVVANKFKGIYAVLCHNTYEARMCQTINNANIMCLGGGVLTPAIAEEMLDLFLETPFKVGFPADRHEFLEFAQQEIARIEEENFK